MYINTFVKHATLQKSLTIVGSFLFFRAVSSFTQPPSFLHSSSGRSTTGRARQVWSQQDVKLNMIGDFMSGITGQAPRQLDVPFEALLSGTNIDPSRDNVKLQCVYKGSRDGWTALDFHSNCDGRGELSLETYSYTRF